MQRHYVDMYKILPCFKCGGESPFIMSRGEGAVEFSVHCTNQKAECWHFSGWKASKASAINAWNVRG